MSNLRKLFNFLLNNARKVADYFFPELLVITSSSNCSFYHTVTFEQNQQNVIQLLLCIRKLLLHLLGLP
jgi:hypothetical protein